MSEKCIICTYAYNAEKTLVRTIKSILSQTYTNWLWYILDNGSNDSTGNIIRSYAAKYPQIIPVYNKVNNVFEDKDPWSNICRKDSEWLCYIDADDEYKPNFIEEMISFALMHDLEIVASGSDFIDVESNKITSIRVSKQNLVLDSPEKFDMFFGQYYKFMRTMWGKIYKISVCRKFDYSRHILSVNYGSDTSFAMQNFRNASRVGILAKSLHKHYSSKKSSSYQMDSNRLICDKILDSSTRDFLIYKCGTISPQNESYLNIFYFHGINATLNLLFSLEMPIAERISAIHKVLVNENIKRLVEYPDHQDRKFRIFNPILNWITTQREEIQKELPQDDTILNELHITLTQACALNKSDEEVFNALACAKKKQLEDLEDLDIDMQIYKIMKKYPVLAGMTAQAAVFLDVAVSSILRNDFSFALDEITRLLDSNVPIEYTENYLKFAENVCKAINYVEGCEFFKNRRTEFLLNEANQPENFN